MLSQQMMLPRQTDVRLPGQSSPPVVTHMATGSAPTPVISALPPRDVTSSSIEDAYVSFILYCNPGVPSETDTTALREAFRNPPKSGGKTFSTFTLFQLIRQLETKEIKTWAELALKLGVEPPDQDKGQSSQKIQQYAVRLKRWMHSMHMDAFFEYLMDHPHPYWMQIPTTTNPVCDTGRDGVAAEDDMALRALLPQIRPRRGRKRPEDDDVSKSPSQRPRIDSPPMPDELGNGRTDSLGGPWSAHPDGRASLGLPMPDTMRSATGAGPLALTWPQHHDAAHTPLTAFPQGPMSAVTPSTRHAFWSDSAEPRSAITPSSKRRPPHNRHGAKVVSSAWRSTGKTRGRPPINRTPIDGSFSAFSSELPAVKSIDPLVKDGPIPVTPTTATPQNASPIAPPEFRPPSQSARPGKPSISLQVPPRVGGAVVRLATPPPPIVRVNGNPTPNGGGDAHERPPQGAESLQTRTGFDVGESLSLPGASEMKSGPPLSPTPAGYFDTMEDQTNWAAVHGYFLHETLRADWFDAQGNAIEPCGMAEGSEIVNVTVENMRREATGPEAFLINVSALAGGNLLMSTTKLRVTRLAEYEDHTKYMVQWQYRLGSTRGQYEMTQVVPHSRWKKAEASAETETGTVNGEVDEAALWQRKYRDLLGVLRMRDEEIGDLRGKVMASLRAKKQAN